MVVNLMKIIILLCYSKIQQLDVLIGLLLLKTSKETDQSLFAYCCIALGIGCFFTNNIIKITRRYGA